jgi:hypothetical protein
MVTDQLTSFGPAPKQAMIMAIQRVENMRKLLIATLVGSFGALATQGPALAQWPASSSSWKSYSGSTDNCVSRARNALLQAGLSQQVHNAGDGDDISIYGHLNSYAAEVRCIVKKDIVFFMTTGPKLDQATKYREAVVAKL